MGPDRYLCADCQRFRRRRVVSRRKKKLVWSRAADSILARAAIYSLGNWFRQNFGAKSRVSCAQNTGPFENREPRIDKSDLQARLPDFYRQCLQPDYADGFFWNPANGNSESQSYALMQSYLAGDKRTFARVLGWTNHYLKHEEDNLFAWKYEVRRKSLWEFWKKPYFANYAVTILDRNSATDADTDIANALFLAGRDWKNQNYIDQAKAIAQDIWDLETAELAGRRLVLAGNWANEPERLIVNPSYFSPQAYRAFAVIDGDHDWRQVIADSYGLLEQVSARGGSQAPVPVNWVQISKAGSEIRNYEEKTEARDFGYDAFRVLWRVGLDQLKQPSFASWNYISKFTNFAADWQNDGEVCALYKFQNNNYVCDKSTTSTLAAPLAYFSVTNGFLASELVQKYYIRDDMLQFPDTDFYAKSWHWFGTWLWANS